MKTLFLFILCPADPLSSLQEAGKVIYKGQPGHTPESPLWCDISRWQCWLLVSKSEFALGAWVSTILNWHYFLRRFLNCPDLYILNQFVQVLSYLRRVASNNLWYLFIFSVSVVASLIILHLSGAAKKGTGVFLWKNSSGRPLLTCIFLYSPYS